jgi:hypothetical protein
LPAIRLKKNLGGRSASERPCMSAYIAQMTDIIATFGTCAVAYLTWRLVKGQLSTAKEQLNVLLYLKLRKQFDGSTLLAARKAFAEQILDGKAHEEMDQSILTFFEDVGMLLRRNYLDREMVWETFGHFAQMWHAACRDYITRERANCGGDPHMFSGFEYLVQQISEENMRRKKFRPSEPPRSSIKYFLESEALRPRVSIKAA